MTRAEWQGATPGALAVLKVFGPFEDASGSARVVFMDAIAARTGVRLSKSTPGLWEEKGWITASVKGRRTYSIAIATLPPRLEALVDAYVAEHFADGKGPSTGETATVRVGPSAEAVADALLAQVVAVLGRAEPSEDASQLWTVRDHNRRLREQVGALNDEIHAHKRTIAKYAQQIRNLQVSQHRIDDEVRARVNKQVDATVASLMRPSNGKRP